MSADTRLIKSYLFGSDLAAIAEAVAVAMIQNVFTLDRGIVAVAMLGYPVHQLPVIRAEAQRLYDDARAF